MIELALALVLSAVGAAPPPDKVSFTEKLLTLIPDDVQFKHLTISPDGRHCAYVAVRAGRHHVVVDKAFGPAHQSIPGKAYFLGDSKTIVYKAIVGNDARLFVGGKQAMATTVVGEPVFTADLRKFAFIGHLPGRGNAAAKTYFVVVNGRKGPLYERCGVPAFSADGRTYAYTVQNPPKGGRNFGRYAMVVNGKVASPDYTRLYAPVFAPKGKSMAYQAMTGGLTSAMRVMVVNGKPQPQSFVEMGRPHWSPDGKRLAYTASPDRVKRFLVVDGKPEQSYDYIGAPVWNKTGSSYAYRAQKGLEHFIVVNGKPGKAYKGVGEPSFAPDGKTVAFGARVKLKWMVVRGEKEGPADFEAIYGPPVFSADGKHVAYQAGWRYKWIVAVDDGKGEIFDTTGLPVWNPAGDKLAYSARKQGKHYMVVHYRRLEPFEKILTPPVWNKEGTMVAFGARKQRAVYWRVVNVAE